MNYLLIILLLVCQIDWDAAEKQARVEKSQTAAFDTMRTDTTIDFTKKRPAKVEKIPVYNIIVNDKNVDSLQIVIDSISSLFMKELREYDLFNKTKYCDYLLQWNKKDTAQVTKECDLYLQYLMLECDKLNYVLQQQDGDSRVTIHLYIKRNKEYMAQITNYIYRLVKK